MVTSYWYFWHVISLIKAPCPTLVMRFVSHCKAHFETSFKRLIVGASLDGPLNTPCSDKTSTLLQTYTLDICRHSESCITVVICDSTKIDDNEDDDDDDIAYFSVGWKTTIVKSTASNQELKLMNRVETKNGPVSRGSQWQYWINSLTEPSIARPNSYRSSLYIRINTYDWAALRCGTT